MDFLFMLCSNYLMLGSTLLVINTLISYQTAGSLTAAMKLEAVRCGMSKESAAQNIAWYNGYYSIIAWPKGVLQAVRNLFT